MTSNCTYRRVIDSVHIRGRWVLFFLAYAIAGLMALNAVLSDGSAIGPGPVHEVADGSVTQFDLDASTEANGSIDPFAPHFGDGDMFDQNAIYNDLYPINEGASAACFLAIPCW